MTREEIKNRVFEIIADKIGVSICEIQESTRFKEDLGTDSLDDIELIMEFEREFDIKIPDEEMIRVCTVGEAINGICQKLGVSICKKQRSKVDLDEEVHRFFEECIEVHEVPLYGKVKERVISVDCYEIIARHFYSLGLNARKEK